MIRINKPPVGPTIPYERGRDGQCKLINATKSIKKKYEHDPTYFIDADKNWKPRKEIYGHKIIKEKLKVEIQQNKCCYCEKEILSCYTVEHYRPSGAYKQNKGSINEKPGYYWLAYEWKNLFYSCTDCNTHKGALFPLEDNNKRVQNHFDDPNCEEEKPILIDLVNEDPMDFIEFIFVEPTGKLENYEKGEAMIEAISLRRDDLFDERYSYWIKIENLKKVIIEKIKYLTGDAKESEISFYKKYLDEKCNSNSPFSSMIINSREYFEIEII